MGQAGSNRRGDDAAGSMRVLRLNPFGMELGDLAAIEQDER
jgi:hypothetical protein